MAMGYEGYAVLQVNSIGDVALCTGGGVPESRQRLESSSGYGGKIKTPVGEMGIGAPRTYDWSLLDGNLSIEVHDDFLDNQIKEWIFDRQKSAYCFIKTRNDNEQAFNKVYWNTIGLSAAEGGVLEATIGFAALERNTYVRGGDYIGNKLGDRTPCDPGSLFFADPLNPGGSNINPVPYWKTKIEIGGVIVPFTSWGLDFNQDVVKFFACEGNSSPVEPKYVAVGPMSISFRGDYMFVETAGFTSPDSLNSLYVHMGSGVIKLNDLELQSDSDVIAGAGDIVPVAVEYAAYTLVP
jgi:hypothetical protein